MNWFLITCCIASFLVGCFSALIVLIAIAGAAPMRKRKQIQTAEELARWQEAWQTPQKKAIWKNPDYEGYYRSLEDASKANWSAEPNVPVDGPLQVAGLRDDALAEDVAPVSPLQAPLADRPAPDETGALPVWRELTEQFPAVTR